MPIVAIVLAAGSSTRFGANKLLAEYKGRALYLHALDALEACAQVSEIIVVVRPQFEVPADRPRCRFVVNVDHLEGMGSSLRAGVRAAPESTDAFLIALGDMPKISTALVNALLEHFSTAGKNIVIPSYQGRRGHPVVMSGELRELLLETAGDVGAKKIVREHPEMISHFVTDDPAVLVDVDVPADLAAAG